MSSWRTPTFALTVRSRAAKSPARLMSICERSKRSGPANRGARAWEGQHGCVLLGRETTSQGRRGFLGIRMLCLPGRRAEEGLGVGERGGGWSGMDVWVVGVGWWELGW